VQTIAAKDETSQDKEAYINEYANQFDEAARKLGVDFDFSSHIEGLREKVQVLRDLRYPTHSSDTAQQTNAGAPATTVENT
jgi:hypothetical protein